MIAFLEARRAGLFQRHHWLPNIWAGVIVGVVALPLSMAFAIASGARPEQGLYTAIVAGFLGSLLGGSRVQISGPTGAFVVILAGVTAKYGFDGLQIATLMAGVLLLIMGLARLGAVIKFIPTPVILGFTAGIATIIWVGQWPDFFGLPAVTGAHFHQKLWHLLQALPQLHPATTALALLGLLLAVFGHRLVKPVPGPLLAIVVVTLLQVYFQFDGVATIGSVFGEIPRALPSFKLPDVSLEHVIELLGPAFAIAMLAAIESLLSAVVADGMTGHKHDSNQELVGQGVLNMAAPLLGGFAATGGITRTATSIKNGATSPLAGVVHAITLLLIILLFAPYATYVPLCAMSAILFVVAYNMSEVRHAFSVIRTAPRNDVVVLLTTFVLTVFADLVLAVNVGVILATLLFMKRMSESVQVSLMPQAEVSALAAQFCPVGIPKQVQIYSVDGPFFFGATETFERTLAGMHEKVDVLILRLGSVPFIDATAIHSLHTLIGRLHKRRTRVILCEANATVLKKLEDAQIVALLGVQNVQDDLGAALGVLGSQQ